MTVYVDHPTHPYGRMIMCHMIADTHDELIDMVKKIGVNTKWIQREGSTYEHFDIAKSKRILALQHGAISVSTKDIVLKIRAKKIFKAEPREGQLPLGSERMEDGKS